jgi:serine acetyltransferase
VKNVPNESSVVHSKIDYCHSLLLSLPAAQRNRLQHVLNSAARQLLNFTISHLFLSLFIGSIGRGTVVQRGQLIPHFFDVGSVNDD